MNKNNFEVGDYVVYNCPERLFEDFGRYSGQAYRVIGIDRCIVDVDMVPIGDDHKANIPFGLGRIPIQHCASVLDYFKRGDTVELLPFENGESMRPKETCQSIVLSKWKN